MTMTTTMTRILLSLFLIISFSSCDQLTGASTGANDFLGELTVGGLAFAEVGSNKIRFEGTANNGGDEGHHFEIRLNFPLGEKAKFFFFASQSLQGGVEILLDRVGAEVDVTIGLNGVSHTHRFSMNGDELALGIDIHNDHSDAHILIWPLGGPYAVAEDCVDLSGADFCIYNTDSFTDPFAPSPAFPWGSQGRASGVNWGFEGDRDIILELRGPLERKSNV